MKHNSSTYKKSIQIIFTILISTNVILANGINPSCADYIGQGMGSERAENVTAVENKATFIGADGKVYIANDAFVHGGKLINAKKFTAPKLSEISKDPGETDSFITIQNFLHGGKYYTAKFSLGPNAIENTYVQTMPFPIIPGVVCAGHPHVMCVQKSGMPHTLHARRSGGP